MSFGIDKIYMCLKNRKQTIKKKPLDKYIQ